MHLYAKKIHLYACIRKVKSLSCIYTQVKIIYMHTYVTNKHQVTLTTQ